MRHAVIADDNQVDGHMQGIEAGMQFSNHRVDMFHGFGYLRTVGAVIMPGMIDIRVVKRDQMRTLIFRELKP